MKTGWHAEGYPKISLLKDLARHGFAVLRFARYEVVKELVGQAVIKQLINLLLCYPHGIHGSMEKWRRVLIRQFLTRCWLADNLCLRCRALL